MYQTPPPAIHAISLARRGALLAFGVASIYITVYILVLQVVVFAPAITLSMPRVGAILINSIWYGILLGSLFGGSSGWMLGRIVSKYSSVAAESAARSPIYAASILCSVIFSLGLIAIFFGLFERQLSTVLLWAVCPCLAYIPINIWTGLRLQQSRQHTHS